MTKKPRYTYCISGSWYFKPNGKGKGFGCKPLGKDKQIAFVKAKEYDVALSAWLAKNEVNTNNDDLAVLLNAWLDTCKVAKSTMQARVCHIKWWVGVLGGGALINVNRQKILIALQTQGVGTGANKLDTLRLFFNWAMNMGYCHVNPTHNIKMKRSPRRNQIYSPAELEGLIALAEANDMAFMATAIQIARATGLRRSDILSLRWNDIDKNKLVVKQNKTGETLYLDLPERFGGWLNDIRKRAVVGTTIIADEKGKPISINDFDKARRKLWRIANIEDRHFHDIRRSFAVQLYTHHKFTLENVRRILGHRDTSTTWRYLSAGGADSSELPEMQGVRYG